MKFGDNLKKVRKMRKISQEELANRLGLSRQSVSKWETGENYPFFMYNKNVNFELLQLKVGIIKMK